MDSLSIAAQRISMGVDVLGGRSLMWMDPAEQRILFGITEIARSVKFAPLSVLSQEWVCLECRGSVSPNVTSHHKLDACPTTPSVHATGVAGDSIRGSNVIRKRHSSR
ncbi:hypothetical protein RhoFasGS6_00186 [Rhodococcus fascians]|nr:hypothetical protein [Rhodococcus fascians]